MNFQLQQNWGVTVMSFLSKLKGCDLSRTLSSNTQLLELHFMHL